MGSSISRTGSNLWLLNSMSLTTLVTQIVSDVSRVFLEIKATASRFEY